MMTDFETALDLAREIQFDDATRLREEGFRLQDERIEKRAAQIVEEQAEKSDLMTAILVDGGAAYAARLNELTSRIDLHQPTAEP
ncbi:hypothetical protein [Roseobacter sp. MH60115]|uniref:hypothetical protein n=1 Tax=Roseobacter sp. MH60115 TaxID=2785324 RepID=UPI0018A25F48|nr:hypothetical protein [Roseobacter sp. MH60115]